MGITPDRLPELWKHRGGTPGWLIVDKELVAIFLASDVVRPEALEAVKGLHRIGVETTMLTGDNADAADAIAQLVNIDHVHSQLMPREKVSHVEKLILRHTSGSKRMKVAMIGDGVNDAPALAISDVGIAMGVQGTAVAMETADVSLMVNDLRKVVTAIVLGRDCRKIIIQNCIFAIVCKVVMILLTVMNLSTLWIAILVDVGSMLLVSINSSTILKRTPKSESKLNGTYTTPLVVEEGDNMQANPISIVEKPTPIVEKGLYELVVDEIDGVCDANLIRNALLQVASVESVEIDMGGKSLSCKCGTNVNTNDLVDAAEGLGFDVKKKW